MQGAGKAGPDNLNGKKRVVCITIEGVGRVEVEVAEGSRFTGARCFFCILSASRVTDALSCRVFTILAARMGERRRYDDLSDVQG